MRAGLQFPYQIKYLRVLHVSGAKVLALKRWLRAV
jgi:hypothetical protein